LGRLYADGHGVSQDYDEAMKWFGKAAEQGFAEAQHNLGSMYDNGEGVEQDYSIAFQWYTKAAQQGYVLSETNLGTLYLFGDGVDIDYNKAYDLFKKAAKQGEPVAIANIGQMYEIAAGFQQSNVMAFAHYKIASSIENELSENINRIFITLKSKMTPSEIQQGEKEAQKLMSEYGLE
jgi:TPR repeat protein